jgi:putative PIN family toxin of toxin-antitoxin system
VRAVLDPNVFISALLSPTGTPARILRAWSDGAFELVTSKLLLAELGRALAYPKLRRLIPPEEADRLVEWIAAEATVARDPEGPPEVRSEDPGDDYLITLVTQEQAVLVSGDRHLTALADRLPVFTPAEFWEMLTEHGLTSGS